MLRQAIFTCGTLWHVKDGAVRKPILAHVNDAAPRAEYFKSVGNNVPQEAPQQLAQAMVDVDGFVRRP